MTIDAQPDAPDVSIRARAPSPRRLNRKVLMGGALVVGAIVALAVVAGLSERADRPEAASRSPSSAGPPEIIQGAASQYRPSDLAGGGSAPGAETEVSEDGPPSGALEPSVDPVWRGGAREGGGVASTEVEDPGDVARNAPILFSPAGARKSEAADARVTAAPAGARGVFLSGQRADRDARLTEVLSPPRSRYELMAGAVIPAALLSELNSDLPGRVIAQVTSPVYDTASGVHLLIPQGARLIGSYDNAAAYGDRRLLLVWNRLVFPDGWSIALRGMEATDPSGAAGLSDRTDRHLDRLAGAIGLSAIISVIANEAEDGRGGGGLTQSVGDAAAQEAARSGARIVERELTVRPTLRVRVGAPVRVLVTRDIQLRPYRGMQAH